MYICVVVLMVVVWVDVVVCDVVWFQWVFVWIVCFVLVIVCLIILGCCNISVWKVFLVYLFMNLDVYRNLCLFVFFWRWEMMVSVFSFFGCVFRVMWILLRMVVFLSCIKSFVRVCVVFVILQCLGQLVLRLVVSLLSILGVSFFVVIVGCVFERVFVFVVIVEFFKGLMGLNVVMVNWRML